MVSRLSVQRVTPITPVIVAMFLARAAIPPVLPGGLGLLPGCGALGATTVEVHPLPSYLEVGLLGYAVFQPEHFTMSGIGIHHGLAVHTDQVDVRLYVGFIPGHLLERQFLDQAAALQNAKGRIDGGQGHGREVVPHPLEYLLHRWMVGGVQHGVRYRPTFGASRGLPTL